jgi:hypothetical protein
MKTVIPIKAIGAAKKPADDGWRPLSTLSEPRLSEMAANYRAIGYEVEIRDIMRNDGGCNTCFDAGQEMGQVFGTLYVRKREEGNQDNELFE